jgi:twitching motility protein PilT
MAFDLEAALKRVIETGGSDLHLKVPSPPLIRIHGKLQPIPGADKLMPNDTEDVFRQMVTDEGKREEFQRERELDFSFGMQGAGRFRVNAFHQRGSISFVFRAIPSDIKTVEELNLPGAINDLADEERGIILVTGTTGSGKSTTLAAMIDRMNTHHHKHIVTIEDPIEFLHRDKNSIINQREVGQDTLSFKAALKRVLRQDPDVILVGEMRDEETVRTALSAAETGHLVLSTLHTVDAPESINRIIDFFEPHMQPQARAMLAGTLKGVISQRLARTADGQGRVAVCEVLKATARIKDMIMDPDMTGNIPEAIAEGAYYGMQTFDQALLGHLQADRIDMDEALSMATSPHDFKLMAASGGASASSLENVEQGVF